MRNTCVVVALAVLAGCASGAGTIPQAAGSAGQHEPALPESSVWSVLKSPDLPPGSDGLASDILRGVSGTGANDVWAVGANCCYASGSKGYDKPVIEHWDGTRWKLVASASNEPLGTQLYAVTAIAPDDAWAVGYASQAVFEHWDGKKWSVVSSPYIYDGGEMLSVVAISKNNVWAGGEGNFAAILEHWDGKSWSFIPAYNDGLTFLNAMSASGANDIWAVGEYWGYPDQHSFSEHWNGTTWSFEQAKGTYLDQLNGVADVSPSDAWAVGYQRTSIQEQIPQTLIEHWNGASWSIVPSPNKDPGSGPVTNQLNAVYAISANDIWAVGVWTSRSLFVHYDGKKWRAVPGPAALESSRNSTVSMLFGLTRLSSGQLWAVGYKSIPHHCCQNTLTVEGTPH